MSEMSEKKPRNPRRRDSTIVRLMRKVAAQLREKGE